MSDNLISIHGYIKENSKKEFNYGVHDCCTFSCGLVKRLGKGNPLKKMGMKYTTEVGAAKTIKKLGGLSKAADDFIGERIPLAWAGLGDIVLGEFGDGDTLGICMGVQSVFITLEGTTYSPTLQLKKAWRF